MEDQIYQTISKKSEGFYKEKGSKFIAFAYPVKNTSEVKENVGELKKEYYDARHHCFAYILKENNQQIVRANDDGEPGHSAGDPILGQIKSFELENVLVVVVRYFGGTKLGVSGLIHAYKTAAEDALSKARIVEVVVKRTIKVSYPYDKTNDVMRLVGEFEIEVLSHMFEESCQIIGKILPSKLGLLQDKVTLIHGVELV